MLSAGKNHLQVTAALIFYGDRVLIAQRRPGTRHAGQWEFPGGKQEPDESLKDCLAREIKEELNLDIDVGGHFISVDHDYDDFSLTLHGFFCRPRDKDTRALTNGAWIWVKFHELKGYDLLPADRLIAAALESSFCTCR
ncbi:MAG: (deoxy)nucleoside triphosphate pyrophosphohydrolase [Thermodesulfobacteriota bacterium]|nr:(deoxy)nucleoside triphosphate pyrophosphohydrolase [Thermodesulfobacteriota bacterium]